MSLRKRAEEDLADAQDTRSEIQKINDDEATMIDFAQREEVASYLKGQLDEEVNPQSLLKGEIDGGARLWRVEIDGFEFVVKDYSSGRGGTPLTPRFLLTVRLPNGNYKAVHRLADLLR